MKKLLILSLLMVLVLFPKLSAQGLKLGYNLSTFSGKALDLSGNNSVGYDFKSGFAVGGFVNFKLSKKFSLQPELYYSLRGAKYTDHEQIVVDNILIRTDRETKYRTNYLDLPILLRFAFNKKWSIAAGPYMNAFLNGKFEQETVTEVAGKTNRSFRKIALNRSGVIRPEYGYTFGLAFNWGRFSIEGRYTAGLTDIFKDDGSNSKNQSGQFFVAMALERVPDDDGGGPIIIPPMTIFQIYTACLNNGFIQTSSITPFNVSALMGQTSAAYVAAANTFGENIFTAKKPVKIASDTTHDKIPLPKNPVQTASDTTHDKIPLPKNPVKIASDTTHDKIPLPKNPVKIASDTTRDKLHPRLKSWLADSSLEKRVELVVTFQDNVKIPRFPEPVANKPDTFSANEDSLARAQVLVQQIRNLRAPNYAIITAQFDSLYDANVIKTFWLINGIVAEIPLKFVPKIALRPDVLYIEPVHSGEKPPAYTFSNNVEGGRVRIGSDPLLDGDLARGVDAVRGWIGLLDTGVQSSHSLFTSLRPPEMTMRIWPHTSLTGFPSPEDDYNQGHGTSSAAIIMGYDAARPQYNGIARPTLFGSYKVYDPCPCPPNGLNVPAVVGGLEGEEPPFVGAVPFLFKVILVEAEGDGDHLSAISQAANQAFVAGAVVIAPNGNHGPTPRTVNAPANARKVIGVGAYIADSRGPDFDSRYTDQSLGPTIDGRIKPDIQAPTGTITASTGSAPRDLQSYSGTSGAAPYVAGAALLLRNLISRVTPSPDPGYVYALLILSGQQLDLTASNINTTGAGPINLPNNGCLKWGKVELNSSRRSIDIPIQTGSTAANSIAAAIWWPEADEIHNNIDLILLDPSNVERAGSRSVDSVFEKTFTGSNSVPISSSMIWKLRVEPPPLATISGSQVVYWAVHIR